MKYKAIFFDLDGTLSDPKEGIHNSIKYALDYYNYDYSNLNMDKYIGPPLFDTFKSLIGEKNAQNAITLYRERFVQGKGMFENELYEGIEDVLKYLKEKGYRLFTASSKPEIYVQQILEHFKIDIYFEYMGGASLDSTRSEKTKVIKYVLDKAKINAEDVLMVGDRKYDLVSAQELNMDAIGVLYGYGSLEELENLKSIALINNIREIKKYI